MVVERSNNTDAVYEFSAYQNEKHSFTCSQADEDLCQRVQVYPKK